VTVEDLAGADIALLVGGDAHDHHYSDREWDRLLAFLEASGVGLQIRWHVSTSRRSPARLADSLAALAVSGNIVDYVDYRQTGPGSGSRLFGLDAIVVTQDSRSMIAEALAARRPVIILRPEHGEGGFIDEFSSNWYGASFETLPIAQLDLRSFAAAIVALAGRASPTAQDPILTAVAPVFGIAIPDLIA